MLRTEKVASDVEICDTIYEMLETGCDPPDTKILLICAQISAVFVKALEKRMTIRMRIMVDDVASPMITKVHPTYFRYAVKLLKRYIAKSWMSPILELLDGLATCDVLTFPSHRGKHIEAWVSLVDAMDLTCTCGTVYKTPVNSQRCRYGHTVTQRLEEETLKNVWDLMDVDEKNVSALKMMEFSESFPETPLLAALKRPETVDGETLVTLLNKETEGTHVIPYTAKSPMPELMDENDVRALTAYRVGKMLSAKATADALLLADFLDKYAPAAPLDRACWQLQLRHFKDPDKLNAYRARVEGLQKKYGPCDTSVGVSQFVERIKRLIKS